MTGFALLFGTTWVVNALVFAGVLLAVLAAVEVTRRCRTPPLRLMYACCSAGSRWPGWYRPPGCSSCRSALAAGRRGHDRVPADLRGQRDLREAVRDQRDPTLAFAANLLGAMVGGCLEYLALVTGYRTLLVSARCSTSART